MVAIPLLSGVVASEQAEWRQSPPLNLEPVVLDTKISEGQFRAPSGAVPFSTGPGIDRTGIEWGGQCFRVMGTKLVKVDRFGVVTVLGDVGGEGYAAIDYGFDRLAVASNGNLHYYDGTSLTQVTDEDLGPVIDMIWVDGYYMTTDGTYIVVTELSDPFQVLPLKYGSAEEDPDAVTGLTKIRGEVYVLGRNTIQVFSNVGGSGFPFASIEGATIPFGCISPSAKVQFAESFAFVGSARNEGLRVYLAGQGTATPISTRWVEDEIAAVQDPTSIRLESRASRAEQRLLIHLPDKTLVFCAQASANGQQPIWYVAQSGDSEPYRIRNAVRCYGMTLVGDLNSSAIGLLSDDVSTHFDEATQWRFDAGMIYNEGRGAIVHDMELVGLPGRGAEGRIFMSYTRDGENFSMERAISTGAPGDRKARLQWRPHLRMRNYLGLRFRGFDKALPGFSSLEARIEPLS